MLRQDRLAVLDETERRLEFAAHRQKLGRRLEPVRQRDRRRREAAGAAQHPRPAGHHPHHRIVDPVGDLAVVHQRVRGDAGKRLTRRRRRR